MTQLLRRSGPGLLLVLLIAPLLGLIPGAANAAPAPYAQDTWGVYNRIVGGTLSEAIRSEVMAIEQIGNRIFVGGKFTQVRQTNGSSSVNQRFLAAFDATTGAYISNFTPTLSGPVYSLQRSPDGSRLFVGGEFGDVGGVANTRALVALNPNSGAVDTSWVARVSRNGRAVVYSMDEDGTFLYVGGGFDAVAGNARSNAAKIRLSNASVDSSWTPSVTGGTVWGIAVAPNRSKVYLGGYFTAVNGVGGTEGFVPVDNSSGAVQPGRIPHNNLNRKYYLDVEAVNNLVFVAGMEHITWVMNATTTQIVTKHSTGGVNGDFGNGGDYQDLEVVGNRVYAACHCRGNHYADGDVYNIIRNIDPPNSFSREDPIKFVAAYSATDGSYDPSFTLDVSGSSGVWAVHGASDGCLWVGGDLTRATRADGTNQARGGFTKHCDPGGGNDTERPGQASGVSATASGSNASLSWNAASDNVGVTGYQVYRATSNGATGTQVGTSSSTSFTDSGLANGTYWYYLKAFDAAGNVGYRTGHRSVTINGGGGGNDTERPDKPSGINISANGSSASLSWTAATDNVGVTGYQVYRATSNGGVGSQIGTPSNTSYTDSGLANGTYWYYLKAFDAAGNVSWRTGYTSVTITGGGGNDTERPSTPIGFVLNSNTATSASFSWTGSNDNVGVTGYRIFNGDGSVRATTGNVTSFTVTGLTSNTSYPMYVKAFDAAGNESWRSNTRTFTTN